MSFAVLHIEKGKGSSGGLQSHIDRTYEVKNADPDRAHLNFRAKVMDGKLHFGPLDKIAYEGKISDRERSKIESGHTGKKIRDNAVTRLHLALSGSHEQMKEIEKSGKIKDWAAENFKWVHQQFGHQNIIEFTCHMDERTPHIHCIVVPINKKTKTLNAKSLMSRDQLKGYQDSYGKAMNQFGLHRGLEGSRATHESVKEFYAKVNEAVLNDGNNEVIDQVMRKSKALNVEPGGFMESKEAYRERVLHAASNLIDYETKRLESKLAAKLDKNNKTFRADLHKSKLKLDKADQLKMDELRNTSLEKIRLDREATHRDKQLLTALKDVKSNEEINAVLARYFSKNHGLKR